MLENKLYKIKTKKGNHINKKLKKDGSLAAIQFDDNNGLQGPVDLIEVEESEYTREVYTEIERQKRSFGQAVIEDAVVPAVSDALTTIMTRAVEAGINAFGAWMSQTVIPAAKAKSAELIDRAIEAHEMKKTKQEEKKSAKVSVRQKTEVVMSVPETEDRTVIHTQEEVDQILNNMKFAALYIAAGIRELSNTAIADDGTDPEKMLAMQEKLKELSSGTVMNTIEFMLEDKNRDQLDQATIQLFEAFRHKDFIIAGEAVPISKYLSAVVEAE